MEQNVLTQREFPVPRDPNFKHTSDQLISSRILSGIQREFLVRRFHLFYYVLIHDC